MSQQILVVEDEEPVSKLLAYNLRKAHYEVQVATDGRQALQLVQQKEPDLILLDLMLPEIDGLDVCREIRRTSQVPIIMLTAQGEEIDRVVGLELGADDYVCKPFSVREILARIKAVLRRAPIEPAPQPEISTQLRQLKLDTDKREAKLLGKQLELSKLEFDLLHLLLTHPGRAFTREELLERVWGYDFLGDTRAVDSSIKRLRIKMREIAPSASMIVAVRGIGYKLNQDEIY